MNDHEMEKSLISAYCDGELNAIELARAEELLQTSEAARAELQGYRKLSALLHDSVRPLAQANLASGVLQAIQQQGVTTPSSTTVAASHETSRNSRGRSWVSKRLLTLLVTSAACLAVVVWLGTNRGNGKQELVKIDQPQPVENQSLTTEVHTEVVKPNELAVARVEPKPELIKIVTKPAAKPLEANQLPVELIADLKNSNVGRIQKFIRDNKDGVTVFHLMVVDLKPGMESLELILSAQEISAMDGKPVNDRSDVVAVYVEAKQDKMDAIVQQIKVEHEKFLALAVQRDAVPNAQVAALAAKKTTDSSQSIPINVSELENVGVEPLKSEQITMARNEKGRRSSRPPGKLLANSDDTVNKVNESPMLKLLILVEKATPESLLGQPAPKN
ncbi:MAG: hypothetical protein JWM11_6029 [Planctomycetaceae bacterium]|nr:hypothetical protein [Planctomycetaceae bacterium]